MKRSVSFLLVIIMLFALASCGGKDGEVTGEAKPGDVPVTPAKKDNAVLFEKNTPQMADFQ